MSASKQNLFLIPISVDAGWPFKTNQWIEILWGGSKLPLYATPLLRHWQYKEGKQRFCFEEWMNGATSYMHGLFYLEIILLLMLEWPRGLNVLCSVLVNWELIFNTTKFGLARKIRKFPFPCGQIGSIVHLPGQVGSCASTFTSFNRNT